MTPWLDWLLKHEGEPEYTGTTPTAFVQECFSHTTFGKLVDSTPPSCAATLCAALEENGYLSPHSAAAISFSEYGTASGLVVGAICVFEWQSGMHHVSCCLDPSKNLFLGGNQGHMLQRAVYNPKFIIATRWPVKTLGSSKDDKTEQGHASGPGGNLQLSRNLEWGHGVSRLLASSVPRHRIPLVRSHQPILL